MVSTGQSALLYRKNIHEHSETFFLIVSSLEMGMFHNLQDRPILEHAVSSCGSI
jgi:hypothetical protein